MKSLFLVLAILFVIAGCKPTQQTQTAQSGKYSEDLSALRPKIEPPAETTVSTNAATKQPKVYVEPLYTVNKQLDAVLDSIDRINVMRKFIDGYTIQVYSGLKREDALNVKKQISTALPNIESEVQYVQPNFRVKTGKYFTLLEAEEHYEQVRQLFPSAIVVPDKIAIN